MEARRSVLGLCTSLVVIAGATNARADTRERDPTAGLPRPGSFHSSRDDASIRAGIDHRAAQGATALPSPGGAPIAAGATPSTGGPLTERVRGTLANVPSPPARGGGPLLTPVASSREGAPADFVHVGAVGTREVAVALPIGCSRLVAVGTPAVRSIALRVLDARGDTLREQRSPGRMTRVTFCARDRGADRVQVEARGSGGIVDAQVFVE